MSYCAECCSATGVHSPTCSKYPAPPATPAPDAADDLLKILSARTEFWWAGEAAAAIVALRERVAELERDKNQWSDLYIGCLDRARGYRGIDSDSTLADALQTLVDMRLSAEAEVARLIHDGVAYQGALGYPVPGHHDGKLSNGATPTCGLCAFNSRSARDAEAEVARLTQERDEAQSKMRCSALEWPDIVGNPCAVLEDAQTENAKLRAVVEAAKALRDAGVNICQQAVQPDCMDEADALNELIGLFDGPIQRAFDATFAAAQGAKP